MNDQSSDPVENPAADGRSAADPHADKYNDPRAKIMAKLGVGLAFLEFVSDLAENSIALIILGDIPAFADGLAYAFSSLAIAKFVFLIATCLSLLLASLRLYRLKRG